MPVNIIDPELITVYLDSQANGDPEIANWLNLALAKSLRTRPESAEKLTSLMPDAPGWLRASWNNEKHFHHFVPDLALTEKVRHIKDWLLSGRQNDPGFMKDVDANGRSTKLLNLDLPRATKAADKYFALRNELIRGTVKDDQGTKTVMQFADGSRIVQLLTPAALRYEGPNMGHCIAGGTYDDSMLDGRCTFYSLRDPSDKPHATLEIETKDNALLQCKGKNNLPPIRKYIPYVQAFITAQECALDKVNYSYTGLIKDDQGIYHSLTNLPQTLSIRGDLDLEKFTNLTALPDTLSCGWLNLKNNTNFKTLPTTLSCRSLNITNCTSLKALPTNLSCQTLNALNCTNLVVMPNTFLSAKEANFKGCTSLTSLPDNFSCEHLDLRDCANLKALPDNFSCIDLVIARCSSLKTLPDNFSCHELNAFKSGLTALPENFVGTGNVDLSGCTDFTALPNNFSCGNLDIRGCTNLKTFPRSASIRGEIHTNFGVFETVKEAADAFDREFRLESARPDMAAAVFVGQYGGSPLIPRL